MKRNYGDFLGATLLYLLVSLVLAVMPIVGALALLFLGPPLWAGWAFISVKAYRGQSVAVGDLSSGFDRYGSVLGIGFLQLLLSLLTCVPVGLGWLFATGVNENNGYLAMSAGGAISAALALVIGLRFGFALVVCLDTNAGAMDSLRGSWRITGPIWQGLFGLLLIMTLLYVISWLPLVLPALFLFLPFALGVLGASYGLAAGIPSGQSPGALSDEESSVLATEWDRPENALKRPDARRDALPAEQYEGERAFLVSKLDVISKRANRDASDADQAERVPLFAGSAPISCPACGQTFYGSRLPDGACPLCHAQIDAA